MQAKMGQRSLNFGGKDRNFLDFEEVSANKSKKRISERLRKFSPAAAASPESKSPTSSSPQRNQKMTVIDKSPSAVQSTSPGRSRPDATKTESRKGSRSPEKCGRRDSDLISTATSALRRLHFRSAGGSRTKRGQTTTAGGQSIPKLMVMGSSTTSETTTNTSTDSSNTVYTMVTVTDAEQEERTDKESTSANTSFLEEKLLTKSKETLDAKRESKDLRRLEKRWEMRRSKEILNEFDELFLENEKRIRAEEKKNERKFRKEGAKYCPEKEEENRKDETKDFDKFEDLRISSVTTEDIHDRRMNAFHQIAQSEKKSSESEEERFVKRQEKNTARAAGSSSERDSDEIFSSVEEQAAAGSGALSPTPLALNPQKDQQFLNKTNGEEIIRNVGPVTENGPSDVETKGKPKVEKPRSNVRTIQSELPQLTIRSKLNKKSRKEDQKNDAQRGNVEKYSEMTSLKTGEDSLLSHPRRSGSPKLPSTSASPKFNRSSSSNLKRLAEKSAATSAEDDPTIGEVVPLTTSNLEKYEKQLSEELKKQNRSKYENIFNMDSPTTIKSSPPIGGFFDPTKKTSNFEFPSCISPTEINNAFAYVIPDNGDLRRDSDTEQEKVDEGKSDLEDVGVGEILLQENGNKRRRRSDRKSISMETPIKLLAAEEKIASNRKSEENYRDLILEDNMASLQNRKYSILTTDGSIKNFVSENSEDYKKSNECVSKENKKKKSTGIRRGSECPQRHRRVSIIQGDSLRHFIFEEPEPRTKSNRRKMSMMPEDTTKNLLLEDTFTRKSSLVPGDTLRNLLGDEATRKPSDEKARKFSINTLGDIVSARKFSLLPPGEIYTSQIDGKTTEIIKLTPGTKGRPLATIVVQQASIQRGSISGPSQKEDALLDVANTFTLEELHEFDMKYGSPHHCRSQSVKTPGRSCGRPNYLCLPQQRSRVASMPNTGVEEEYYRLRHFSITGKGVVNRGDSLKSRRSRSNNSVASSNSSHSTEHLASNIGTVGSHPGSARTSAECSLASSRESSTTSMPYKVVMLGGAGVGKTSLISQFMTSEYLHAYDTSLDEEYGEKSVSVLLDGEESELIFVDHPSAEMSPENCITTYEPQAYIVVYSVVDRSSLQIAEETLQSLWKTDSIASKAVILVGNKIDLVRSRTVTTEEGKNMARSYDCKFIETSVGINHNVDELLVGILTQIRLKIQQAMKPKRNKSPLGSCIGKDNDSPKKWRNSRLSASLKVKGLFGRVWARDSKSKSFSGESLTTEELDQYRNYIKCWLQAE